MKLHSIALAVNALLLTTASSAFAQSTNNATTDTKQVHDLGTIEIVASADASKQGLMPAYQGGQVATGTRVGVLGNKDILDTPFSTVGYTQDFIKQKQANSVGDVLKHDPSVRVARGFRNFQEAYIVRGFVTNSDDTMMNGLYGILPRQYIASELFERVEVQRGAGTFLNGMAPGGTNRGGTIALLPKRADNNNSKKVELGYGAGNRGKITADLSQRFGEEQEFGTRLIASYQNGHTAVDMEKAKLALVATGLDYRGDALRVSADLGYQDHKLDATRNNVEWGVTNSAVPNPNKSQNNWAQPWNFSNEKDVFGTLRAEYDLSKKLTAYAAYGFRNSEEENSLAVLSVNNANTGAGSFYRFDNTRKDNIQTGEIGLRGTVMTGDVSHDWAVSANSYTGKIKTAYIFDWVNSYPTNIFMPVRYNLPAWTATAVSGGDLANPVVTSKVQLDSVALVDTIGMANDKLQTTVGARYQSVKSKGFDTATGVQNSNYKKSKVTPVFALNYRPLDQLSFFANYAENLTQGDVAPATASNAGQTQKPHTSKQKEIGVKLVSDDQMGATLTAFHVDKPRYATNANNVFGESGKNVHQGVEFTAFGEAVEGVRVLGGFTFLDTKQKNTGNTASEGKQVIGAARFQANAGVEYDVPQIEGLTLTGDVIHTGKRYVDSANTAPVKGYTTLDLGARVKAKWAGKNVSLATTLGNVTNQKYWASVGGYENAATEHSWGNYLNAGQPRHVKMTLNVEF